MTFKQLFSRERFMLMALMAIIGWVADVITPVVRFLGKNTWFYDGVRWSSGWLVWLMEQLFGANGVLHALIGYLGFSQLAYGYELATQDARFDESAWMAMASLVVTIGLLLLVIIVYLSVAWFTRYCFSWRGLWVDLALVFGVIFLLGLHGLLGQEVEQLVGRYWAWFGAVRAEGGMRYWLVIGGAISVLLLLAMVSHCINQRQCQKRMDPDMTV